MLKITGVKLEKVLDIDIYLFIKKGLRGAISYIAKKNSEANNKCLKDHDPTKPSGFIEYLDKNNLYGWAVSGYLPYGGFKWLKNVDNFGEKSPIGYILEVDLEYPDELLVLHNDNPLSPAIPYDMVSDYSKTIAGKYRIKVNDVRKLILNFCNKTNYVVHYRSLPLYLSLGMKLTKIHKVLKFKQSTWMKKYIDFNTEKRRNDANSFEKNFDDQFCLWKNNGSFTKKNQCQTSKQ